MRVIRTTHHPEYIRHGITVETQSFCEKLNGLGVIIRVSDFSTTQYQRSQFGEQGFFGMVREEREMGGGGER